MTQPEIRSLTGLRGIAATMVMLDHYAAIDFSYSFPLSMLPHMYLAVDMFMVLSGFILARVYMDYLDDPDTARSYGVFILRRIARLYPLYALTTVVCFGLCRAGWLTFLSPDTSALALLANLLAIQTWLWPGPSLNGPGWSISTEWFANLIFLFLVPLMLKRPVALAALAGGLAVVVLVLSAALFGQLFDVPSPGAVNIISGPEALGRCVSEFIIGMLCCRLRFGTPWTGMLGQNRPQLALLLVLALLFQDTMFDTVFVVAGAALLIGLSYDTSPLSAVLQSAPLLHLGRVSYSIYLLHITLLPVRDQLAQVFSASGIPVAWCLAMLCTAVMTLLLATLTWRYIEVPAQKVILSLWMKRDIRPAQ